MFEMTEASSTLIVSEVFSDHLANFWHVLFGTSYYQDWDKTWHNFPLNSVTSGSH